MRVTSLGKGFFEFAFSSLEDVQRVRSVSAWNLPQGVLKLFPWPQGVLKSGLGFTGFLRNTGDLESFFPLLVA